jgi:hypothetical protein
MNDLASQLSRFAKRQRLGAWPVTRLFREFALCSGQGCFAFCDQAFWNRPRSQVLVPPERPAGMTQQDFDTIVLMPIEE